MKRTLFLSHRWLGIGLSLLFVLWFVSGVVMMYVRMPILTPEERFARLPRLDMTAVRLAPAAAWSRLKIEGAPKRMRLNVVLARPAYHFLPKEGKWKTVFADTGQVLTSVSPEMAGRAAAAFAPGTDAPRFQSTVATLDQWTMTNSLNLHRPLHRFAIDDAAKTELYVSQLTGEVVMRSTGTERAWAWLGPVMHWIAPEFIRTRVALWRNGLLWLSVAGTLLTFTGLVIGVQRLRREGYFLRDAKGEKVRSISPYRGPKKWHHWSGLVFGFFAFTWIFSGLLYTNPGGGRSKPTSTVTTFTPYNEGGVRADVSALPAQSKAMTGGPPLPSLFALAPATAWRAVQGRPAPREIECVRFGAASHYVFYDDWDSSRIVAADKAEARATRATLSLDTILDRARLAVPGGTITEATLLHRYDAYYYAVGNVAAKRLPIVRVCFSEGTWFYINPHDGSIFRRYDAHGRAMRWLVNGLHCLDFPFLMFHRPAWDAAIIILSLGGLVLSLSGLRMGVSRVRAGQKQESKDHHAVRSNSTVLPTQEKTDG